MSHPAVEWAVGFCTGYVLAAAEDGADMPRVGDMADALNTAGHYNSRGQPWSSGALTQHVNHLWSEVFRPRILRCQAEQTLEYVRQQRRSTVELYAEATGPSVVIEPIRWDLLGCPILTLPAVLLEHLYVRQITVNSERDENLDEIERQAREDLRRLGDDPDV